ncbi:MAG: DNA polymerase beta superfamily protein, partial [Asticcacaulis sp.]
SRAAETNQGVDWKAMSHAVRIAGEAVEFLRTRSITFPRPEASHLVAIKLGQISGQAVAQEIEDLLEAVEQGAASCDLPDVPADSLVDAFIADLHGRIVRGEFA